MSKPLLKHDGTNVIATIPGVGIILASGTAVPADGAAGYAPGCLFIETDAADGSQWTRNDGTATSADFNQPMAGLDLSLLTTSLAELNYLDADLAANVLTVGSGVDGAEGPYKSAIFRDGPFIVTRIYANIDDLIGSATDLDIIGESAAANCHWGQITAAKSGTIFGGRVTCLEVPAGGSADVDFYSSDVATGVQDVIITDPSLGTETALVTAGGAWTLAAPVKSMSGLPNANDYIYIVNGAASGGTFSAGKFLIEFFGL